MYIYIHKYIHPACIYKGVYYEELVNVIMEVEKFHNLPSASWRPRSGVSCSFTQFSSFCFLCLKALFLGVTHLEVFVFLMYLPT